MRSYRSAEAFRQALEDRLKRIDPAPLAQKRLFLAIQRLLARVAAVEPECILKGGLGLRLRDTRARTTRDLDLRLSGERERDLAVLRSSAALDLDDFFVFTVEFKKSLLTTQGNCFHCVCSIAGRLFAEFDIDAAAPEPLVGEVSLIQGIEWLTFVEIETPAFRVYPLATQIAEKVHALTLPRARPNTRDRDVPDLAILGRLSEGLGADLGCAAIASTFQHRKTHDVPARLASFPAEWAQRYQRLVDEHGLEWRTFESVAAAVRSFIDPLLDGSARGTWSRGAWGWR